MKKGCRKCICCGEFYPEEMMRSDFTGEPVCETCYYEDEPCLTVYYNGDEIPYMVGHYRDETEGDFEAVWHSTDAWRGYYEVKANNGWKELHSDCILAMSDDERELENFDDELRELLDNKGIGYARVFSKTSNLFSQGYDVFVREEDLARVEDAIKVLTMVNKLREKYRDPERFTLTALTGKDEFDGNDMLFVKLVKELDKGKDLDEIKGDLLEAI